MAAKLGGMNHWDFIMKRVNDGHKICRPLDQIPTLFADQLLLASTTTPWCLPT
jgi:hypothetical protein